MNQNQDDIQLENSQYFQDFVGDGHIMTNYQEFDQSFVDRLVDKLRALYEPDLFSHSYQTMAFAERIAERYGVDQGRTKVASLLHDYGRVFPPQDLVALVEERRIPCTKFELENPDLLHALAGPELIRENFGIWDPQVLSAVRKHTVGSLQMFPLDHIVYISDKVELYRSYPGVDILRRTALEDLIEAFKLCYKQSLIYVLTEGKPLHPDSCKIWNQICGECLSKNS